jgi:hypothetical protein
MFSGLIVLRVPRGALAAPRHKRFLLPGYTNVVIYFKQDRPLFHRGVNCVLVYILIANVIIIYIWSKYSIKNHKIIKFYL